MTELRLKLGLVIAVLVAPGLASAQSGSARDAAVLDITGYWISVVTEDWKYRMVTPNPGEYGGLPLNAEGRGVADTWDPSSERAAGDRCGVYGAPAIMRMPGRLHIDWQDEETLRIETEAGAQTRLFRFGAAPADAIEPSRQGWTQAEWRPALWQADAGGGSLKVVTRSLTPGFLRGNGVPYSANTVVTEYFNTMTAPNGDRWLVVTTIVEDPDYLSRPYVTSSNFKKLDGRAGWNPTECEAS